MGEVSESTPDPAEGRAREADALNRQILASATVGIAVYDRSLRYVHWNRCMEDWTGLRADQVLGRHPLEVFPFLKERGVDVLLQRALAGEGVVVPDGPFTLPDSGRKGWSSARFDPLRGAGGGVVGVIGIIQDITERKAAELALRESEEALREARSGLERRVEERTAELSESEARYRDLFENASDLVAILGEDGRFLFANRSMREVLGYTEEELRRMGIRDLVSPEELAEAEERFRLLLAGEEFLHVQRVLRAKDGRRVVVEGSASCRRGGDGPVSIRAIFRDVTREREMEAALRRSEMRRMQLEEQTRSPDVFEKMVGKSGVMEEVQRRLRLAGRSDVTVLLTGESGTGKELAAAAVHAVSDRRDKPFVAVNCAAIPETLLESELFGHVKGAFTGALRDKAGLFDVAQGGTLFLDEVGDMSPVLQVKILRALQEREIRRVGDERVTKIDVKVVAATNRNLLELLAQGKMREDFYYRIRVFEVRLPPLRERREDIPLLVAHFIGELERVRGKKVEGVEPAALEGLMNHPWPGNVRELRNALEHAFVTLSGPRLRLSDLPPEFVGARPRRPPSSEEQERERIVAVLKASKGNRVKASAKLGISRVTLWKRLQKLGIDPQVFKK